MLDKERYKELVNEIKNLPSSSEEHQKLFQLSQLLTLELLNNLSKSKE